MPTPGESGILHNAYMVSHAPRTVPTAHERGSTAWCTLLADLCGLVFAASIYAVTVAKVGSHFLPWKNVHQISLALGIVLITVSIRALKSARRRKNMVLLHQSFAFLGGFCMFVGGAIMWELHSLPGRSHFISWHGCLGGALLAWLAGQMLVGLSLQLPIYGRHLALVRRMHRYVVAYRSSGYILVLLTGVELLFGLWEPRWARNAVSESVVGVLSVLVVAHIAPLYFVK